MKPRSDRRAIDRAALSPFEVHCASLCRQIGATFVGIQKAYPEYELQAQVIVLNAYRSSLAIPVTEFSVGRLLVEPRRSELPWVEAEDRKADQLRQFAET